MLSEHGKWRESVGAEACGAEDGREEWLGSKGVYGTRDGNSHELDPVAAAVFALGVHRKIICRALSPFEAIVYFNAYVSAWCAAESNYDGPGDEHHESAAESQAWRADRDARDLEATR